MIKIAICDDDNNVCQKISQYLFNYEDTIHEEIKTDIFTVPNDLKDKFVRGKYDLLFVDIEMPSLSGIQLTEYIRNNMEDNNISVVFVSSHTSYALELFKIRPMDFLIKPVKSEDILRILKQWCKINKSDKNIFTVHSRSNIYRLKIDEIIYIESSRRKIFIHCRDFTTDYYGKLNDITDNNIFNSFIEIHKSFFVNYNHIVTISNNCVILTNGDSLPISQHKRSSALKKFVELEKT